VEHVGGDMFRRVPKGDAIFMKVSFIISLFGVKCFATKMRKDVIINGYFLQWILHDWSDEQCLKLLKNCYDATPNDGKVIVVEAVLPVMPEMSTSAKINCQMDVLMMTQNPGGKERTEAEFMGLATKAGFSGIRYESFVCNFWVMEFFK